MHQIVQAAIDAANAGQTAQAMQYLKQVLTENPNDAEAWLVLAAVVEDPVRKRQCLERVLKLDPANQLAREELLEMDRQAMTPEPPVPPVAMPPAHIDMPQPVPPQAAPPKTTAPVNPPSSTQVASFSYPLWMRLFLYGAAGVSLLFVLGGILEPSLFLCAPFSLLFLFGAWMVSVRVEVSNEGIRVVQLFAGGQMTWQDIARIKTNVMQRNLELQNRSGKKLKITSQVSGYPRIIEGLRQKRPDLFGLSTPSVQTVGQSETSQASYEFTGHAGAAPGGTPFSGTRMFKKSFIRRYGSIILGLIILPIGIPGLWSSSTENLIGGLIIIAISLYLILASLFAVQEVTVEPGRLTIKTIFDEDQLRPDQITGIRMQTVRGRRGTANNLVVVQPADGKAVSLGGFDPGDEILYGTLTNWWQSRGR
jgi:hypothetical protein